MPSGMSLRLARIRAGRRQLDVAISAGCSRARIGQVEGLRNVSQAWVDRYRRALETVPDQDPKSRHAQGNKRKPGGRPPRGHLSRSLSGPLGRPKKVKRPDLSVSTIPCEHDGLEEAVTVKAHSSAASRRRLREGLGACR